MTAYLDLPIGVVDQGSPLTQTLIMALRDNPIAMAEGAAGAPRIDGIKAMIHQGNSNGIGTYMLAVGNLSTNTDFDFGDFVSGSNLDPVGIDNSSSVYNTAAISALPPLGTWRCMGFANNSTGGIRSVTLYLRVA